MISRGLLISLVVTGVSTACLWLYFRNRLGDVEKKVDLMFDFIQDHEQRQMASKGGYDDINVSFSDKNQEQRESEENNPGSWNDESNSQPDLIQVSEDEDSDEEETEESDSDEEQEEEEEEKADVENVEEIVLEPIKSDVKIQDNLNELNEVESVPIQDNSKIKLQSAEIDSLDELTDGEDDEDEQVELEETKTDYSKLTVTVLKELAEKKGLSGYKSLKKAALIKLIEDN